MRNHWVALYVNGNNVIYFDILISLSWTYSKRNKKSIGNKNIIINIYKIQSGDSIICGQLCVGCIDLILGKNLLDYTNLFSPEKYEKHDKMLLKYFQ